ncbi:hypothetical protein GZH46_00260, partial [Fragariocoptes setiger]
MPLTVVKVLNEGLSQRPQGDPTKAKTIYEFQARDIDLQMVDFDRYKHTAARGAFDRLNEFQQANREWFSVLGFLSYQFKRRETSVVDLKNYVKTYQICFDLFA